MLLPRLIDDGIGMVVPTLAAVAADESSTSATVIAQWAALVPATRASVGDGIRVDRRVESRDVRLPGTAHALPLDHRR